MKKGSVKVEVESGADRQKMEKEIEEIKKVVQQVKEEGVSVTEIEKVKKEVNKIREDGEGLTKLFSQVIKEGSLDKLEGADVELKIRRRIWIYRPR